MDIKNNNQPYLKIKSRDKDESSRIETKKSTMATDNQLRVMSAAATSIVLLRNNRKQRLNIILYEHTWNNTITL